jgi:hypothetical protein
MRRIAPPLLLAQHGDLPAATVPGIAAEGVLALETVVQQEEVELGIPGRFLHWLSSLPHTVRFGPLTQSTTGLSNNKGDFRIREQIFAYLDLVVFNCDRGQP